jgi:hypothetical protein
MNVVRQGSDWNDGMRNEFVPYIFNIMMLWEIKSDQEKQDLFTRRETYM